MMTEELKPCPLCGGKATVSSYSDETLFGVYCTSCTCRIAGLHPYYNIDSAIKAWNTRTNTFPDWLKKAIEDRISDRILSYSCFNSKSGAIMSPIRWAINKELNWVLSLKPEDKL